MIKRIMNYRKIGVMKTMDSMHKPVLFCITLITAAYCSLPSFAIASGNTYYVSKNGSNSDGLSWATAWNELDQINWSEIQPGDTVTIDGGSAGMAYSKALIIGKSGVSGSPITIERSTAAGHNGAVNFFGGRGTLLPYCGQPSYSYQTAGVLSTGIAIGNNSYVVIDGGSWHGISIYGYNGPAITFDTGAQHDTIRNLYLYDDGTASQSGSGWNPQGPALVMLQGSNHVFQNMEMKNGGEDAFQPVNVGNITIQLSWLHDDRNNPNYPGTAFNQCNHDDGMQIWTGNADANFTFDQDIIGPGKENGLILGNGLVTVSNVSITNSLFIAAGANNIWGATANGWTMDHITSFALDQNLELSGSGNSVTNSIFYGGAMNANGSLTADNNNCQYNTQGQTLGGVTANPMFASDLTGFVEQEGNDMRTTPTLPVLQILDFSLTAGSPCAGLGASITSVNQFLTVVSSGSAPVNNPIIPPTPTPTDTPVLTPIASPTISPEPTPEPTSSEPVSVPPQTGEFVIYDNAVSPAMYDYSYSMAASAPCDASLFVTAPCSYGIMFKPYGGFNAQLKSGTMSTTNYGKLVLDMYLAHQPVSDFVVFLTDKNGNAIVQVPLASVYKTKLPEKGWIQLSIPVPQLNPAEVPVKGMQIQNATDHTLSTIHIDDIRLAE